MMASTPRMNERELKLVRFIVQKLAGAYCNSSGRPIMARSMNRVMEDVFGVKHFTKWLEKASRSQPEMVKLILALDLNTVWNVTRSKQHYRMLVTLVAMDDQIVKLHKKLDKIAASEPSIRPTKQYRKISAEAKQYEKRYKQCVKLMRDIFDIKKGSSKNSLLEFATAWRDEMRPDNDYFSYFDSGYDSGRGAFSTTDSMEEFLQSEGRPGRGAFGIFSELDDEENYFSAAGDMGGDSMSAAMSGGTSIDKLTEAISTLIDRKLADAGIIPESTPSYSVRDDEVSDPTVAAILKQNAELVRQNAMLTQQLMGGPAVHHRMEPDIYMGEEISSDGPGYSIGDMMGEETSPDSTPRPQPAPIAEEPTEQADET